MCLVGGAAPMRRMIPNNTNNFRFLKDTLASVIVKASIISVSYILAAYILNNCYKVNVFDTSNFCSEEQKIRTQI